MGSVSFRGVAAGGRGRGAACVGGWLGGFEEVHGGWGSESVGSIKDMACESKEMA